jgi:hypothetical protein
MFCKADYILRLGDRASYINKYRYQLDAANDLFVVNQFSTFSNQRQCKGSSNS